jgi:acyl-CoA thioester hydrolase
MKKEHTIPVQVRFNDIDLMGHVYNAKYQEFFDLHILNILKKF